MDLRRQKLFSGIASAVLVAFMALLWWLASSRPSAPTVTLAPAPDTVVRVPVSVPDSMAAKRRKKTSAGEKKTRRPVERRFLDEHVSESIAPPDES